MRKVKFDFGHLMIQKLNRTFVMTKSTLGVLNYRVRVIQLWFCFGLDLSHSYTLILPQQRNTLQPPGNPK